MEINRQYKTRAIILDRFIIRDKDLIFRLFTERFGKIDAIGYSGAKSYKRFGGRGEKFSIVEIIIKKVKDNFFLLKDINLIDGNEKILSSLDAISKADTVTEVITKSLADNQSNKALFDWFELTLTNIAESYGKVNLSKMLYDIAKIEGYLGGCDRCSICNKKIERGYFSVDNGIVCNNCKKYSGIIFDYNVKSFCSNEFFESKYESLMIEYWEKLLNKKIISKKIYKNLYIV